MTHVLNLGIARYLTAQIIEKCVLYNENEMGVTVNYINYSELMIMTLWIGDEG
jgi:hypothetical protein